MLILAISRPITRIISKVPLRTVLIVPFVLQIVSTVGLVGYLSFKSGQNAVEKLAQQLMAQVGERISDRITSYLSTPQEIVAANHLEVEQGTLNLKDFEQLRQQLWQQITLYPTLTTSSFWSHQGTMITYGRILSEEDRSQLHRLTGENFSIGTSFMTEINQANLRQRRYYVVDANGKPQKLVYSVIDNIRNFPWYLQSKAAKKPIWSPIIVYQGRPILEMLAIAPVSNPAGQFQGFFTSDVSLARISTFLNHLHFSPSGQTFILERSGNLVATSSLEIHNYKQTKRKLTRLLAVNSQDTRTRDIARQIINKFGNFHTLQTTQQLTLWSNNQRQFVQVTPYRDQYGLDWLIVVVVPESDFIAQIHTNTRTTIELCIAALIISIGVGILIARWITKPIRRLNIAAKNIAQGEWGKTVELEHADEVGELANSFADITQRQQAEQLLANYNRTLETQVAERTAELTRANEKLQSEIAERKLLEGKLYSSEQQVRAILEAIRDLVLIIDHKNNIQVVPTKLFYSSDPNSDILNSIIAQFFQDDTSEIFISQVQQVLNTQQNITFDYTLETNNRKFWFTASISPLTNDAVVWVARDISDKKLAAEQHQQSHQRYQELFEKSLDGIVSTTIDGRFLNCNASYEKMLGYSLAELQEKTYQELTPAKWYSMEVEIVKKQIIARGYSDTYQKEYIRQDGTVFPVEINAYCQKNQAGQPETMWAIVRDISERKQFEQALIESEDRFQAFMNYSPLLAWISDANGKLLYCNRSVELWSHRAASELIGQTIFAIHPPEIAQEHLKNIRYVINTREVLETNESAFTYDGKLHQFLTYKFPIIDANGQCLVGGIAVDITARKLAEAALQESQSRLEKLTNNVPGSIYELIQHPDGSISFEYVSSAVREIHEVEPAQLLENPTLILAHMHPDDRAGYALAVEISSQTLGLFRHQWRIITPSGKLKWLQSQSKPERRSNGDIVWYGAVFDITDKKLAQEAFQESQARLQKITNNVPEAIYEIVRNQAGSWSFEYISAAVQEIYELTPEQVLENGSLIPDCIHPDDRKSFYLDLEISAQTLEPFKHEYRIITPSGKIKWLQATSKPECRSNGDIVWYGAVFDITDKKQAEEALCRYERIVAATTDGISLVDRNYIYQVVNYTYLSWRNQPYEQIVGHSVSEILGTEVFENYIKDHFDRCLAGETVHYQDWFEYPVRGRRFLSVTYSPYVEADNTISGVVVSLRDLTELQQAEAALRQSEAQLNMIVTNTTDGIMIIDQQSQISFANPAAIALFNLPAEELIGHQWRIPLLETTEIELRDNSGQTRIAEMKAVETTWQGESAYVVVLRDISDRKISELALQQALIAAEAANLSKSAFLANMSHELRTPLNGILGYAQILQRQPNFTPKQTQGINIIYQCGTHLLNLINDILDLSKIEAGKLELYPNDFDFPSFLQNLCEIFRLKASQKEIDFIYTPINPLPTAIHADEKRLRQVLMNLLSNAVKFTDSGSVNFTVSGIEPGEDQQPTTPKIRFQIEDTGIGIPPAQLAQIFLAFEQVKDSCHQSEGTGLGLSISQKIVSLMGSEISVESTPEVGSRFWFDIALPIALSLKDSTPLDSKGEIIGYQGEKRQILIVDDRWENCTFLTNLLEPIGFEVQSASNGEEGLEKASQWQPDLIISDLLMPQMDGFEMAKQLRQLSKFETTILIATSASVFETERKKSLDCGYNDFLPKPLQAEEILKILKKYLDLDWIYKSQVKIKCREYQDDRKLHGQATVADMIIPPAQELISLYEAAQIGHVEKVQREVFRLQELSPNYINFAIRVLEFANKFDYEELVKLLEKHGITKP